MIYGEIYYSVFVRKNASWVFISIAYQISMPEYKVPTSQSSGFVIGRRRPRRPRKRGVQSDFGPKQHYLATRLRTIIKRCIGVVGDFFDPVRDLSEWLQLGSMGSSGIHPFQKNFGTQRDREVADLEYNNNNNLYFKVPFNFNKIDSTALRLCVRSFIFTLGKQV